MEVVAACVVDRCYPQPPTSTTQAPKRKYLPQQLLLWKLEKCISTGLHSPSKHVSSFSLSSHCATVHERLRAVFEFVLPVDEGIYGPDRNTNAITGIPVIGGHAAPNLTHHELEPTTSSTSG